MLFAEVLNSELVSAFQAVALGAIAAWVTINSRKVDGNTKAIRDAAEHEKKRCDALEKRVRELERLFRPRVKKPAKKKAAKKRAR